MELAQIYDLKLDLLSESKLLISQIFINMLCLEIVVIVSKFFAS